MVRSLLSALSPTRPYAPPVLSKDLERVNRVVTALMQAVEDEVLTDEEADAVIGFVAERFIARRFDVLFDDVLKPKAGGWFMAHAHSSEE